MTDDVKQNTGIEVPGEAKPLSRVQEEALAQGWVPRDEFQGEEDEFIDAAEFVRRGELFRKIESQSKEMKDMRKALQEMAKHNQKIAEVEYQKALATLKAEKKQALAEGDYDKVEQVEEQIDLVKDQQRVTQQQAVQQAVPQEIHPEFKNWIAQNSWYETDPKIRAYADALGAQLASTMSPVEVLKAVSKDVKEKFFQNPNRQRPGAVESPVRRNSKAEAEYELSPTEKSVMETLVRQKVLTKEQYIEQLKAIKSQN